MTAYSEMPVVAAKYYEFLKWLMHMTSKFPRNQRYVFGKTLEDKALAVLDKLIKTYYKKNKIETLKEINLELEIIRYYLKYLKNYNLELHEQKSNIRRADEWIKFLGYRIFPEYRLVNKENVKRFKRKLRKYQKLYKGNKILLQEIGESIKSWIAHVSHADSYVLRKTIFNNYVFNKG